LSSVKLSLLLFCVTFYKSHDMF